MRPVVVSSSCSSVGLVRGELQRLALLHHVLVEVEVLGPAHQPEADADERGGEAEAEQVAVSVVP